METISKSSQVGQTIQDNYEKTATAVKKAFTWEQFWKNMEFNRYGIATYVLVALVCISGVAAAVAVQDPGPVKLLSVAFATTLVEAMVLAVAPMRVILFGALATLLIDLLVIFI